ncbi:MAG: hypothetical protein Kow0056_05530 [Coriobacteriia bacterium]
MEDNVSGHSDSGQNAGGPDVTQVMPASPPPGSTQGPPSGTGSPSGPPTGGGRNRTLIVVAVVVVVLLLGWALTYVLQTRRLADLESDLESAQQTVRELSERLDGSEVPTGTPTEGTDGGEEAAEESDSAGSADADGEDPGTDEDADEPPTGYEDGQYIGYITDIWNVAQSRWIQIDYIQFLTGDEAAAAAAARGDESPPPNDYYIVNDNPLLREFNVREGLEVTMWTWDLPGHGVAEDHVPFDIWWDAIEMGGRTELLRDPYWITVDNGTVIEIEEQYLP